MVRRNRDLLIVMGGTLAGLSVIVFGPTLWPVWIRACLLLPLVFVYPGFALLAAWQIDDLDGHERWLFSMGISPICAIAAGAMLHVTGWGLQTFSWAALLGTLTTAACLVGAVRRQQMAFPVISVSDSVSSSTSTDPRNRHGITSASWTIAVLTLTLAVTVALVLRVDPPTVGFTQFWTQPLEQPAPEGVVMGVRNLEDAPMTYRLELVAGDEVLREWPDLLLQHGEAWKTTLRLPAEAQRPIRAVLIRQDRPDQAYRSLILW